MNNNINYLYIILCSLSFTLFYFAYKFASDYISNIHLIILQYFILSAFFIIYIIFKHKEFIKEVNLRTIGYASVLGLTSIFSALLLYIMLKSESFVKIVSVLEPLIVIISVILGTVYLKDRLSITNIFGIILALIGVYLTIH